MSQFTSLFDVVSLKVSFSRIPIVHSFQWKLRPAWIEKMCNFRMGIPQKKNRQESIEISLNILELPYPMLTKCWKWSTYAVKFTFKVKGEPGNFLRRKILFSKLLLQNRDHIITKMHIQFSLQLSRLQSPFGIATTIIGKNSFSILLSVVNFPQYPIFAFHKS